MRVAFNKEWDDIVAINVVQLYSFEELEGYSELTSELDIHIGNIFDMLRRIKNNKFYSSKEVESIYLLIKQNVDVINEILIILNNRITTAVYELILNIFEELILLAEDYEMFEISGNLLAVRDYWFSIFNIKIQNSNKKGAK